MDAINSFLSIPVVQLTAGFTGGALVSALLYWVARRDSRREARELQRLSIMMMNAMEAAGWEKWVRDENGDPTGRVVELSGTIEAKAKLSATATPTVTYSTADREYQAPSEQAKEPPSSKE